jgi:hypothetical protein
MKKHTPISHVEYLEFIDGSRIDTIIYHKFKYLYIDTNGNELLIGCLSDQFQFKYNILILKKLYPDNSRDKKLFNVVIWQNNSFDIHCSYPKKFLLQSRILK